MPPNNNPGPIVVALLAAPDVSASTLYGFYDSLCSAGRDWQMLHGRPAPSPPFKPVVVSRDGAAVDGANGVRIRPDASFADCPAPDVVCVTDLMVPPGAPLGERYDAEIAWLRERHGAGALLASACSGALLLARTGLLDGLEATSHWAYCDALQREHPQTQWHRERGLIVGGETRIVTAGSGTAWHQLVLFLIARYAGPQEAMQVARINLLDLQETSATAYASLTHGAQAAGDALIARCQEWAALNYQTEAPVSQMVALSGLPERTFKRRFTQATGMSPLEYVHTLRLEEAKQLLESSDAPVEAIALEVGYQDASFFSRLFRRKVALTPALYRRRFQPLSQRLRGAVAARDAATR